MAGFLHSLRISAQQNLSFLLMFLGSAALHFILVVFVWLFFTSDTLPQVMAPQQGRYSIALQAMRTVEHSVDPLLEPLKPQPEADPHILKEVAEDSKPVRPQWLPELPAPTTSAFKAAPPAAFLPPPPPKAQQQAKVDDKTAPVGPKPSASSRASEGSEVDDLPRHVVANPLPPYPADLLAAGIERRVTLRVLIGANGRALSGSVDKSSGYTAFDESALQTVLKRWQFVPAKRQGVAVDFEVRIPIDFYLVRYR